MYRGFNLKIGRKFSDDFLEKGKTIAKELSTALEERIEDLIKYEDIIDGNEVISNWFPQIECDVFLSHSHKDENKALAGYLKEKFGLRTFIDSSVWGFSDKLLKIIDKEFCLNKDKKTFNYEQRNYSTSHIHLMLKSALDKMIDNCEAVFFLNTPNSISIESSISQKTKSPWIFSEIATTQIIRKKTPKRLKKETRLYSSKEKFVALNESAKANLQIEYELELSHLIEIDIYDIILWNKQHKESPSKYPLDLLYKNKPINKKFLI